MATTALGPQAATLRDGLTAQERARYDALRGKPYLVFQTRYSFDPRGFALNCIEWTGNERPRDYQLDTLDDLVKYMREALRTPHGVGKTAGAAIAINWFALTRDGRTDWKIPTTAGSWRQLDEYLWPEVHKWARRIKWDVVGRSAYIEGRELLERSIKLSTGEAFAVASDQPALIEGAHASSLLYVFDEAKAIPGATFDAAEGALSQHGLDGKEAYALVISTPGPPTGRFYEIQKRAPGYQDWHARHVTSAQAVAAGQVSQAWVDARRLQWGEQSAVFRNRVKGEFAADDEAGIIPLVWIEAAIERWHAWQAAQLDGVTARARYVICDVARSGVDKNVFGVRIDYEDLIVIAGLEQVEQKQDTMETTGQLVQRLDRWGGKAIVDTDGLGAGVTDRARELGRAVLAFHGNAKTYARDRSGELQFANLRTGCLWGIRDRLDPASREIPVALPPDDLMIGDLTAPRYKTLSSGVIMAESKEDIKKRIGRSTDTGDVVMMGLGGELIIGSGDQAFDEMSGEETGKRSAWRGSSGPDTRAPHLGGGDDDDGDEFSGGRTAPSRWRDR